MGFYPFVATASGTALGPWQFKPETYGATGNGKVINDATVTGTTTMTSASANFTSADTGKSILITQAGSAPNWFNYAGTITFVNSTTVTLSPAATFNVGPVGAIYGTDDTAALQSCINAAVTYAQGAGNHQYAEVVLSSAYYCVAGNPVTGGSTLGNAQLTLPVVTASGSKVTLGIKGTGLSPATNPHWLQQTVNAPGSVLVCMNLSGISSDTNGNPVVLGGPFNGYGGGNGTFSNMCPVISGLTILTPYSGSIGGLDFFGCAQARVLSYAYMPMAVVPASTPWPQISSSGVQASNFTFGLRMPTLGNNNLTDIDYYICFGAWAGLVASDGTNWRTYTSVYNTIGLLPVNHYGGSECHAISGDFYSHEQGPTAIEVITSAGQFQTNNYVPVALPCCDFENITAQVVDSGNWLTGYVWTEFLNVPGSIGSIGNTGGANVEIRAVVQAPGPVGSNPAVPLTTVALLNPFWRDATVYITSGGAAVTAIAVNGTATGLTLGASGLVQVRVPSGQTITLTYASTAPTWKWWLD